MLEKEYLSIKELCERIPYSPTTIRSLMVQGVFVRGVHYLKPRRRIISLKTRRGEIDPLSFQEMEIFLEHVPKDYYNYFVVAFMTGMRPNEQTALK